MFYERENNVHVHISSSMQAKVNVLRELQSASGEELSLSFHFGDASQSALMPSILDKAFKSEL